MEKTPLFNTVYDAWGDEPGTYTNDMCFRLLAYEAIIKKRGRITQRDLAQELYRYGMNALGITEFGETYSWEGPQKERAFPWGDWRHGLAGSALCANARGETAVVLGRSGGYH